MNAKKCTWPECGATLSQYNKTGKCWCHDDFLRQDRGSGTSLVKVNLPKRGIRFHEGDGRWISQPRDR